MLSEASSLSAREAITACGLADYRVHVVTSEPFCLAAFGTASAEVWRVDSRKQLEALLPGLEARSAFEDRLIAPMTRKIVAVVVNTYFEYPS
jgi:hypothetical protein